MLAAFWRLKSERKDVAPIKEANSFLSEQTSFLEGLNLHSCKKEDTKLPPFVNKIEEIGCVLIYLNLSVFLWTPIVNTPVGHKTQIPN